MNDLVITEETVWQGSVFRVRRQRVRSRDGKHFFRELIHREDGVAVVPILPDGQVLMIREYAAGAGRELLFIPGGQTAARTEHERQREAQRELREETGYRANQLTKLWQTFEAPSVLDRRLHVYLGQGLVADPLESPDADETLAVVPMNLDDAIAAVSAPDGSSASLVGALLMAQHVLGRPVRSSN